MKKVLFMLLLIMILCFPITSYAVITNSEYNIKINVFYEEECEECKTEKNWLEEYKKDKFINVEYINIEDYPDLFNDVRKTLDIKKNKLPLVIIGSNYFVGYDDEVKDKIMKAIDAYEKESNYCDLVAKIENKENTKECLEENKGIYEEVSSKSYGYLVVILILISGGIFIILKRTKKF